MTEFKPSLSIFDFSGVYRFQDFYKGVGHVWVNFTDLSGVNGYCDQEAAQVIEERAKKLEEGIHYIDGGNYHYVSFLLLKKIKTPFSLVVFDHHTDMMTSAFGDLLSCGSWIREALIGVENLKQVILIGVDDELEKTIEPGDRKKIILYTEGEIRKNQNWAAKAVKQIEFPVYFSIDKDVFDPREAMTDWDQGTMTLDQLELFCILAAEKQEILGADVCGERAFQEKPGQEGLGDCKNSAANKRILKTLWGIPRKKV